MGAACSKSDDAVGSMPEETPNASAGTVGVMFDRFDKERKGYISLKNLKDMMKDDKTHFQGRDADQYVNQSLFAWMRDALALCFLECEPLIF